MDDKKRDRDVTYVNYGLEDQMKIYGYKRNYFKTAITWFFIIATVGLLRLFFYWLNHLYVKLTHSPCRLGNATRVLLFDQWKQWFSAKVHGVPLKSQPSTERVTNERDDSEYLNKQAFFVCKKVKYIWNPSLQMFFRVRGLDNGHRCSYFHNQRGLLCHELQQALILYGHNAIRVHVTPVLKILFQEILSPFYVFQVFSVSVWYSDSYEIYASCIVVISTLSIAITIYQTRKMQRVLRNTIGSTSVVTARRRGNESQDIVCNIPAEELVPGDIIEIERHGCVMSCDAVLLIGNCTVNESMLTGESVPITKTALPNSMDSSNEVVDIRQHNRHILFSGTKVIQTTSSEQNKITAIVIRTGFMTSKGELVRAILYPKPVDFKFNRHSYWFIATLAFVAGLGFIYTIILMVGYGDTVGDIILRSLDLLTIAVPPALPAALSVGVVFAQHRLKMKNIYCISPNGINVSGTCNVVCFDKTGTLTDDGMKLLCVVPAINNRFEKEVRNVEKLGHDDMTNAMATCHSLAVIDGEIIGDPLDLIMFDASQSTFDEVDHTETRFGMHVSTVFTPRATKDEIAIVKMFPFSSNLQRMSVLVKTLNKDGYQVYSKGAPEKIIQFCKTETVPTSFHDMLKAYTQHGYRVIALAWKNVDDVPIDKNVPRITRDQAESDLQFLGLLVMENSLKSVTTSVIAELHDADIRTIMITGDNMLTALSVARECGIIHQKEKVILVEVEEPIDDKSLPPIKFVNVEEMHLKIQKESVLNMEYFDRYCLAVSGISWAVIRKHYPDLLAKVAVKGTVFARMSPEQKAQLIECLQDVGYYVAMCGDGANDCGALKTAHTGISLSEAEASVASPFTSKIPTIECVPNLIREGRAALVTSFGIFKFMACYSLTQFTSVLILYWISANLTDPSFVYIDLWVVTTLSITFGRTGPYKTLVKQTPPYSLIAISPILSILGQMTIIISAQVFAFLFVYKQPWFVPFVDNDDDNFTSYENNAIFVISSFQYIILIITFAKGAPYRKNMFTNYWFVLFVVLCTGSSLWLTIYPTEGFANLMELQPFPDIPYALLHVGIAAINCLLCITLETFIIDNIRVKEYFSTSLQKCISTKKVQYAAIEDDINIQTDWPPVQRSTHSSNNKRSPTEPGQINMAFEDDSPHETLTGGQEYTSL